MLKDKAKHPFNLSTPSINPHFKSWDLIPYVFGGLLLQSQICRLLIGRRYIAWEKKKRMQKMERGIFLKKENS